MTAFGFGVCIGLFLSQARLMVSYIVEEKHRWRCKFWSWYWIAFGVAVIIVQDIVR